MLRMTFIALVVLGTAQAAAQTDSTSPQAFDECGTLIRSSDCVLFEGGGGKYYVPDTGRFRIGDAVRCVGELDPNCTSICNEADGCIRGGVLYDPAVYPCGQALPNFPADLITGVCSSVSSGLLVLTLGGLWCTRRRSGHGVVGSPRASR